jgi:cell division protein FtsL
MKNYWISMSLLIASVLISALAVVYAKHQTRSLFAELQKLEGNQDHMDTEWGQLQLEESTWATHGRVESMSRRRLEMVIPAPDSLVIVRP